MSECQYQSVSGCGSVIESGVSESQRVIVSCVRVSGAGVSECVSVRGSECHSMSVSYVSVLEYQSVSVSGVSVSECQSIRVCQCQEAGGR